MQNLIQSDIFFFITSVAVVVITIFILVMLWYIIRILKNIKDVSEIAKSGVSFLSGDLSGMRKKIKKLFEAIIKKIEHKAKKR